MKLKRLLFGVAGVSASLLMIACTKDNAAETSLNPTTVAPTTEVPTTVAPTTEVPTTVAPTTVATTTGPSITYEAGPLDSFKFESKTYTYSGEEYVLEAVNIPEGYRAEYTNNKATEKGKYYANCKLYDSNNELVANRYAYLLIDTAPSAEFEEYCDEFFLEYFGDDVQYWNVFTIDPSAFGYVRPDDLEVSWYFYEPMTDSDVLETYEYYTGLFNELKKFDTNKLSYNQMLTYEKMYSTLESGCNSYNPETYEESLMSIEYIDKFGGYVADFCDTIENYNVYTKTDVLDMISYTKSTDEAFLSYVNFVKDRYDAGYAYSEFTINEMCSYLDDIIADGQEFYLYTLVENKINSSTIDEALKEGLISEFKAALSDDFLVGVNQLKTELSGLVGTYTTAEEGYFQNYGEDAKALYKAMLESRLGYDEIDVDEYFATLETWVTDSLAEVNAILAKYQRWNNSSKYQKDAKEFLRYVNGQKFLTSLRTPEDMIEYLKHFSKTIVGSLDSEPEIGFKYMDDSVAKRTNTVAYYRKSPLDGDKHESITLNGNMLSKDYDEMLLTIAHEGYPGHLYEYVNSKELGLSNLITVATNTGHGEGWAMYVEICLLNYIGSTASLGANLYCQYTLFNQLFGYFLNAYLDCAVNYYGWDLAKVKNYFENNELNVDAAQDFYRTLIEMPTVYSAYGYGLGTFLTIHSNAKTQLGDEYDEISFNAYIMSEGWAGLQRTTELAQEYIDAVLELNKAEE